MRSALITRVVILALLTSLATVVSERTAFAQNSTWERIAKTGVVRIGVIPNRPPYFEMVKGEWQGFQADMSRDVAKALSVAMDREIKAEWVLTSWTTVVLDLQAAKLDFFLAMAMSEERKKALDMFGPIWSVPQVAINAAGFNPGDTWDAYNKPEVKVSVVMGTTDEQAARKFLPKATIRAMKGTPEAVLDIQSGNAQAWITTVNTGLGAMKENKSLSNLVILKPVFAFPSGGGTRKDGDGRFYTFMEGWGWAYRESGLSHKRIMDAMAQFGLDVKRLPKDFKY
ncbi:MAG: transporter substrate-binding domain-containing protein [Syntrophales bacterium]